MAYGTRYTGSTDGMDVTIGEYTPASAPMFSLKEIIISGVLAVVAIGSFVFAFIIKRKGKKTV